MESSNLTKNLQNNIDLISNVKIDSSGRKSDS